MKPEKPLETLPVDIASVRDYERLAPQFMDEAVFSYIAGGAGDESTLRRNETAFAAIQLNQRLLLDCSQASTATTLLGEPLPHPILLGPVAHQKLVHREGEFASAAGAEALDALFVASTLSHCSLEAIASATTAPKWFQLYFQPTRAITLDLVKRAEAAGYKALVVTVDVPVNGLRYRAQRAGFAMPPALQEVNLAVYQQPEPRVLNPDQSIVFDGLMSSAPGWPDIDWLLENTALPVILKGVTHPDDAKKAQEKGVAGVVISNHGGRSLDSLPATIEVLPAIRQAVGNSFPLLLDSGVRTGGDIFKALALGANAVLIGRPQIYALAVAGALGVAHLLRILRTELEVTMALAGCPTVAQINRESLFEKAPVR